MSKQRLKSGAISLFTAGGEVVALSLATILLAGPALVAFRWFGGLFGSTCNYLLNRHLVFAEQKSPGERRRFATTTVVSVTLSTGLWVALIAATAADPRVLHPVSMMSVWMLVTFPMMRGWVFAESPDETAPPPRRRERLDPARGADTAVGR